MSRLEAKPEPAVRITHATARVPGAIAILQIEGDVDRLLPQITQVLTWPIGGARLVRIAGIDDGIVVRLTERSAQLMPHGGLRVVQRITAALMQMGATLAPPAQNLSAAQVVESFPEASDEYEALMLQALSWAASPIAIDLLLAQPDRWRRLRAANGKLSAEDLARSHRLNRLLRPPLVVLAGAPNIGKSTLSNRLLGREMSLALDLPGTTRDYTGAMIDLGGLVVMWIDTPGLHQTDDPIEARAIALAKQAMQRADCLIAMTDAHAPKAWPELVRAPDLRTVNKVDVLADGVAKEGAHVADTICISAKSGSGIEKLVEAIAVHLVPRADISHTGPWLFDERLVPAGDRTPVR